MGLKTYKEKRKFGETPEPEGTGKTFRAKELRFVIQKHNATHLHYDFRLELDGVLKSWAIPKGPSLNPRDKRLAMQVEDHPLEYRKFEGRIPEGNYGAGDVIIWDEGTYFAPGAETKEESEDILREEYEEGSISFVLNGKKLKGEFNLRKFNSSEKNTWLLVKKKDRFASEKDITEEENSVVSGRKVSPRLKDTRKKLLNKGSDKILKTDLSNFPKSKMPHKVKPMLAELVKEPFDDKNWIFEVKWDGYRSIAEIEKGEVTLLSRKGNSFNEKYPEIVESLKNIPHEAVLDGEIVTLDKTGRSNFQLLQNYPRTKEGELVYYVFDLLWLDGYDLRDLNLRDRKDMLKKLLPETGNVRYSDHVKESGIEFFRAAQKKHQEGIMAKDLRSPYRTGERSSEWQKIKTHMRQEAVIAGFTEPRGTRKYLGALVLGLYDRNHELHYAGHAGGGFDREGLLQMRKRLDPLIQENSPFKNPPKTNMPVKWVKPELVCEVSFSEWTDKGIMRQPIFMGLREDKKPIEVIREEFLGEKYPDEIRIGNFSKSEKSKKKSAADETTIARGKLTLTNLNKIYFPQEGYTKGDIIDYYRSVSEYIMPYLKDRPHTLLRHPNGIEGESFFQKDMGNTVPDWIKTVKVESESGRKEVEYLVCSNENTLLYMVNLGCIEINPWFSRVKKIDYPDYMVIDLDPLDVSFDKVVDTALTVKEICEEAKAKCFCKTSGATGLHIYVPLNSKYDFEISKEFAHLIARIVNEKLPDVTSLERSPDKRKGKVYLDYLQNKTGQTVAAPYSVRPRAGAPVSTPLRWDEVKHGLDPREFTIKTILNRLKKTGDIFKPVLGQEINVVKCINNLEVAEKL